MVLAGIMSKGTTYVMNEDIIARGYDAIVEKLTKIGVNIKVVE